jgi:hypothetical protein
MPFKKGQSGNPKGRPKDPISVSLREGVLDSIDKLKESLEALPVGSAYVQGLSKLLPFILPRLKEVHIIQAEDVHIQQMSDSELRNLSQLIINEYEQRPLLQA